MGGEKCERVSHSVMSDSLRHGLEPGPSPGDLPNLGIEPRSPALQAHSLLSEPRVRHDLATNTHTHTSGEPGKGKE